MGNPPKGAQLAGRLQAYLGLKGLDGIAPSGDVLVKSLGLYEKQGLSSAMYLLKIGIADGSSEDLLLRLYVNDGKRALREFKILRFLRSKDLPVPRIYDVEGSGKVLGKPFMIMEKIREIPAKGEHDVVDAAALSLVKVHSIDTRELEGILEKKGEYPLWEFSDLKAMIIVSMFLTLRLPMTFTKYWKYAKGLELEGKYLKPSLSLIHGDYGLDNIVYSYDRAYVVDWESAEIAEPTFDVAYACNMLDFGDKLAGRSESKLSDAFLESYRKYGGTTRDLEFYKRLAALKLLLLIEIITFPGLMLLLVGGLRKIIKNFEVRLFFGKLREHLLGVLEGQRV